MLCHVVQTYGSEVKSLSHSFDDLYFQCLATRWPEKAALPTFFCSLISEEFWTYNTWLLLLSSSGDLIRPQPFRRDTLLWNMAADMHAWGGQDSEPGPPLFQTRAWQSGESGYIAEQLLWDETCVSCVPVENTWKWMQKIEKITCPKIERFLAAHECTKHTIQINECFQLQ